MSLSTSSGAFPVLLVLRFLSLLIRADITPAFGVEVSRDGEAHEIDLGGFVLESKYRSTRTRMILSECKTYNRFERDDLSRIEHLGSMYPGSILIFATLREKLDDDETIQLAALSKKGRRRVGAEEPVNPVMLLTGSELFANFSITSYWKELGGRHAQLAEQLHRDHDLLSLCSITQQLYLDLEAMDLPL